MVFNLSALFQTTLTPSLFENMQAGIAYLLSIQNSAFVFEEK
jgi:hypothetical protein